MAAPSHRIRRIALESSACGALLFVLLLAVFSPAVIQFIAGGLPATFDIEHYFVPMTFLMDTALHSGEFPQWNPYTFCGTPFAANPQSALFYPLNFIRSVLTPAPSPLNAYYGRVVQVILETLIAGIGVYWFARVHRLGYAAAFCAAATFTLSPAYAARLAEFHFVPAVAWFPFIFIALHQLLNSQTTKRSAFWAVGVGMLIGLSTLSGFVQLHVYIGIMMAVYWLYTRAASKQSPIARDAASIAIIAAVAAGISAAALMPTAEFASHTFRAGSGAADLVDFNLRWRDIAAGLFRAETPTGAVPLDASMLTAYLLAVAGLLTTRLRHTAVFGLLFLVLFDCSVGPPLPAATFAAFISPFQIALPQRAFLLAGFPLAMLAGFGVHALQPKPNGQSAVSNPRLIALIIAASVMLSVAIRYENQLAWILTGVVAVYAVARIRPNAPLLAIAATILLATDAVLTNQPKLDAMFDRVSAIDIRAASNASKHDPTRNTRVLDLAPNGEVYRLTPAINGYDPLYLSDVWRLIAPWYYNWNYQRILQAHEAVFENPYPHTFMKRPFWLIHQYIPGRIPDDDPRFDPATAYIESEEALAIPTLSVYETEPSSAFETKTIALEPTLSENPIEAVGSGNRIRWVVPLPGAPQDHAELRIEMTFECPGDLRVYGKGSQRPDRIPLFYTRVKSDQLGGRELVVPLPDGLDEAVQILWISSKAACKPDLARVELIEFAAQGSGTLTIERRTFNRATVTVHNLAAPRVLAFIDANYPGSSVTVDGEPRPLLTVNNAFKGVEVGEGNHTVEFKFDSPTVSFGIAVSIAATGVLLAFLLRLAFTRARKN